MHLLGQPNATAAPYDYGGYLLDDGTIVWDPPTLDGGGGSARASGAERGGSGFEVDEGEVGGENDAILSSGSGGNSNDEYDAERDGAPGSDRADVGSRGSCNGVQEAATCGSRIPRDNCTVDNKYGEFARKHCPVLCGVECTGAQPPHATRSTTTTPAAARYVWRRKGVCKPEPPQ